MTYDAVLLASFGGPEGPDEVMPFLERVTAGRGVPPERLVEVSHHYMALGGVSPINEQNREILKHLREEMDSRGLQVPLYWGNRNSPPFFADIVEEIRAAGHRRVLVLATSAYSSYSGCRQYRENLAQALDQAGLGDQLEVRKVPPYFDRNGFRQPFVDGVLDALVGVEDASEVEVLFTTHSIPEAMAEGSGPDSLRQGLPGLYERQHLEVARDIMDRVLTARSWPAIDWRLVFQSRSGPPQIPWLEPDICDAVRQAAESGKEAVVVVPIGFVSDHVEVIWDLDHEANEAAQEAGIGFTRVATPGVDPRFVASLVDAVSEVLDDTFAAPLPDLCATTCCRNARADLPVIRAC
jgi:protoporphyrin/coproporphyrin ferrochelatase